MASVKNIKNNLNLPNNEKWPIIKNKEDAQRLYGRMVLCGCCKSIVIERKDNHDGVWFCENCGLVSKTIIARHYDEDGNFEEFDYNQDEETNFNSELLAEKDVKILVEEEDLKNEVVEHNKFKRIEWLQNRYDRKTEGDMKTWRLGHYIDYIGIVNNHFKMAESQKIRIRKFITRNGDLNKFHRQRSYEQIITSLCIQCLKRDGANINFTDKKLTKSQKAFLREIELTERRYFSIIEKTAMI